MNLFTDPTKRAWLYRIAIAVIALVAVYGLLDSEQVAAWMSVLAAAFGIGAPALALRNMPKAPQDSVTIPQDLNNDVILETDN